MIDSFFIRMRNRHTLTIPVFAISLFLATIFIASCGDEGDVTEEPSMTEVTSTHNNASGYTNATA